MVNVRPEYRGDESFCLEVAEQLDVSCLEETLERFGARVVEAFGL